MRITVEQQIDLLSAIILSGETSNNWRTMLQVAMYALDMTEANPQYDTWQEGDMFTYYGTLRPVYSEFIGKPVRGQGLRPLRPRDDSEAAGLHQNIPAIEGGPDEIN